MKTASECKLALRLELDHQCHVRVIRSKRQRWRLHSKLFIHLLSKGYLWFVTPCAMLQINESLIRRVTSQRWPVHDHALPSSTFIHLPPVIASQPIMTPSALQLALLMAQTTPSLSLTTVRSSR